MQRLVECDERLQARLEDLGTRHTIHLGIAAEAAAAEECDSKIKSLSTSLCKAEKSLETVISSTKSMLESAKKAGDTAPSAADVVCTAQRIAFTCKLPPYLQPGDCRFRFPWPTDGEFRSSRHLFAQPQGQVSAMMNAPDNGLSLPLKRPLEENGESQGALPAPGTPSLKSPRTKAPIKPVDLAGSMYQVEDSEDSSDSDSGSE